MATVGVKGLNIHRSSSFQPVYMACADNIETFGAPQQCP